MDNSIVKTKKEEGEGSDFSGISDISYESDDDN